MKKGDGIPTTMEGIATAHGIECGTLKWCYKVGTRVLYLAAAGKTLQSESHIY